jgi:hypothetical protein
VPESQIYTQSVNRRSAALTIVNTDCFTRASGFDARDCGAVLVACKPRLRRGSLWALASGSGSGHSGRRGSAAVRAAAVQGET